MAKYHEQLGLQLDKRYKVRRQKAGTGKVMYLKKVIEWRRKNTTG